MLLNILLLWTAGGIVLWFGGRAVLKFGMLLYYRYRVPKVLKLDAIELSKRSQSERDMETYITERSRYELELFRFELKRYLEGIVTKQHHRYREMAADTLKLLALDPQISFGSSGVQFYFPDAKLYLGLCRDGEKDKEIWKVQNGILLPPLDLARFFPELRKRLRDLTFIQGIVDFS
ncbi:MAG TPA: hypothetical protein VG866_00095 [Candidatus Paceibacterota bacterium]|nr:hypothetical protein [Candidatus Paceibacterota bacterium]